MRRSPLRRGKPIARGGPIKRRARIRQRNPERIAKRRAEAFGAQAELCRTLPCAACGKAGESDPAHVRSRGAGGKDRGNVIPLCRPCHMRQHGKGWGALGIDPWAVAAEMERRAYGDRPGKTESPHR